VLATAKAQRWDPAEVLRALLAGEVADRDRSALATRRARAALTTGKTFDAWDECLSSVPSPTQLLQPDLQGALVLLAQVLKRQHRPDDHALTGDIHRPYPAPDCQRRPRTAAAPRTMFSSTP